ncbi:MAG: MBOAT family O-acyltransferase, partial [Ferrovibrio sp.]
MLFNSLPFAIFSAIYFPIHFVLAGQARMAWCLFASYVFYGWWDWRFIPLIALSTLVNFCAGYALGLIGLHWRRFLLIAAIAFNLGLLAVFKYYDFFVTSFREAMAGLGLKVTPGLLELALPVGISFYTFHGMSYIIDIYRGNCAVERNPIRFAAYIALFPQLVAGPIVRASRLLPQMAHDHAFDWPRVIRGLEIVVIGFALKLLVADNLSTFVDSHFGNASEAGGYVLLFSTVFFAFQIYGDFAGYSLIAIGLGVIIGYDFGENFRRPYLAVSFSDFWERWHISLSSWLRDYLYIPLGGNREGASKTARNLFIVMLLGGLWHGANWTFVLWGLLHGAYLVLQRATGSLAPAALANSRIA